MLKEALCHIQISDTRCNLAPKKNQHDFRKERFKAEQSFTPDQDRTEITPRKLRGPTYGSSSDNVLEKAKESDDTGSAQRRQDVLQWHPLIENNEKKNGPKHKLSTRPELTCKVAQGRKYGHRSRWTGTQSPKMCSCGKKKKGEKDRRWRRLRAYSARICEV